MRLLLYAALLFLAGCAIFKPADPEGARNLVRVAEEQAAARDFGGAARSVAAAIEHDPRNGALYLQHGSLLERMNDLAAARETYHTGLKRLAANDPQRPILAWRLGLLFALKLNDAPQAQRLLPSFTPESAIHADLLGILALGAGDPLDALPHFEQALERSPDASISAAILYHFALAHAAAGDESRALGDLYHAASRASHPGLAGDVERLWVRLSDQSPATDSASPSPMIR